jgi:hypothetical protein
VQPPKTEQMFYWRLSFKPSCVHDTP